MFIQFCIFSKMIIPIQQKYNLDDPLQKKTPCYPIEAHVNTTIITNLPSHNLIMEIMWN